MSSSRRPVVVGVNGTPDSALALRWAAEEARNLGAPLRLVHAYAGSPVYGSMGTYPGAGYEPIDGSGAAQAIVDAALAGLPETDSGAPTATGVIVEGHRSGVLLDVAADASLVVVGSRRLGPIGSAVLGSTGAAVAARAACPAVVVRGPAGAPEEGARVVVGVDLSAMSEPALRHAFDHASRYGVPLQAILCWNPGPRLAHRQDRHADDFRTRGLIMLAEALAGWQEKYPDVTVQRQLLDMHPVDGLVSQSLAAHLLVVGAHGRRAHMGTLLGSVSQGVLHHATCPVAVVHADHQRA